jgi:hypothetical protein
MTSNENGLDAPGRIKTMFEQFPYSRYHDPSHCDQCDDQGFVETAAWRDAWDRASIEDDQKRRANDPPSVKPAPGFDPNDPIDSGLAAVRYEAVFGNRPTS